MVTVAFVVLVALVLLGAALVLTGRADAGVVPSDRPGPPPLPDRPLTAADISGLRFRVGLRGYRMEDVDAALAAIAADRSRSGIGDGARVSGSGDESTRSTG